MGRCEVTKPGRCAAAPIPLYLALRSLGTGAKVISEGLVVTVRSSVAVGCGNKTEGLRDNQSFKQFALKRKWEGGWPFEAQKDSVLFMLLSYGKFSSEVWRKKLFLLR